MRFEDGFSISLKITLFVLLGTAFVFTCILGFSYIFNRNLFFDETEKSTVNLTRSVANRIDQEFRAIEQIPETLACVLETVTLEEKTMLSLVENVVRESPNLYGVAIAFEPYAFDRSVSEYAPYYYRSNGSTSFLQLAKSSYNYFRKDWYHIPKQLRAPTWTEPYLDAGGGDILMTTYSVPFFERDESGKPGKLKGIVTADVSLKSLTRLVESVNVAKTGFCFLISGTGTFITHPDPELIMRESLFSVAETLQRPGMRDVGRRMLREEAGFV